MKLLLTSAGFCNETITEAFRKLSQRPLTELSLAFVPTAANVEAGDKSWVIEDLNNCKRLGFKMIDIVDISAIPRKTWQPRLEAVEVIFFGGGNTYHLMSWVEESGLREVLPKLLENRVFVGLSAGSMIPGPWWSCKYDAELYGENPDGPERYEGLGLVNFHTLPHFRNQLFPKVTIERIEELSKQIPETIYLLDDESAVVVEDREISLASEGIWRKFN